MGGSWSQDFIKLGYLFFSIMSFLGGTEEYNSE